MTNRSQVTGGVDTHSEVHVAAVIDATGRILDGGVSRPPPPGIAGRWPG